jgi:hypothetical protein
VKFDLESDEETSLTGKKRSNAAGGKSKKGLKNIDGRLYCNRISCNPQGF